LFIPAGRGAIPSTYRRAPRFSEVTFVHLAFGFDLHLLDGDREFLPSLALEVSAGSAGKVTVMDFSSPVFTPVNCSSKPGMNWPEPITSAAPSAAAFEIDTVNAPEKINDQLVAIGSLLGLGASRATLLVSDVLDRFFNLCVLTGTVVCSNRPHRALRSAEFPADIQLIFALFIPPADPWSAAAGRYSFFSAISQINRFADHIIDICACSCSPGAFS
jgi:hypothetical protein